MDRIPSYKKSISIKDEANVFIARWSLPAIVVMVGIMVYSAMYIDGDAIGIVSAMITAVVGGLIVVLQAMTGADKDDPMTIISRELIENLKKSEERNSDLFQHLIETLRASDERNANVSRELIDHIKRSSTTKLDMDDKSISVIDGNTEAVMRRTD